MRDAAIKAIFKIGCKIEKRLCDGNAEPFFKPCLRLMTRRKQKTQWN